MKYLWGSLKNSKALEKDLEPAIASAAAAAVKENGLEGRFAELERERLARLAREWLEIEKTRRSEEHTSELQSPCNLVCRLLLEKKKNKNTSLHDAHTWYDMLIH